MIIDGTFYKNGLTDKESQETIAAMQKMTDDLIAKGPQACRDFLVKAGIIPQGKIKYECLLCGRNNFDRPSPHHCTPKGTVRKRGLKYRKYILPIKYKK